MNTRNVIHLQYSGLRQGGARRGNVAKWSARGTRSPAGPRFKSRSGHLLDLFSVVPSSNPRSRLYIANCMPGILVPGWGFCPRRDFAQKAKSRGGTLVTRAYLPPQGFRPETKSRGGTLVARAYIKDSTYSSNIQSVY